MDPIFIQFVQDHDDVFAVEYHAWWPGSADPFYQHNIPDNTARIQYYNVNATPWEWVDGVIEPVYPYTYGTIETAYNTRKNVPTSVSLSYTGLYTAGTGNVDITVTASTDAALPAGDYHLQVVLTESEIFWDAPYGLDYHEFIMRDMYPDAGGTAVSFAGGFPQTAAVGANFNASQYDDTNCAVVFFLQNDSTLEVFQAGSVTLDELADPTGVAEAPAVSRLGQNFPNPFNPKTVIPVSMAKGEDVELAIVDAQGRRVRTLLSGFMAEGHHEIIWDGTDDSGASLASGVYMAQLRGSVTQDGLRLLLLK